MKQFRRGGGTVLSHITHIGMCHPVGLSVGIGVTVSIPSNEVRVVIVLTKNVVKIISLVL